MSGALFGGTNVRSQTKNLVEFKAGKMSLKGKMVHADKRKGLIYVFQSSDDQLMHLCWKDRTTGVVEDDLIIFPDDIEYVHVPQCTTGRVYVLKFKSSNRKMFFWMQEAKVDKDEDYCSKLNEFLNHPPTSGTSSRSAASSLSNLPVDQIMANIGNESDMQNILANIGMGGIDQQQLMRLLGGLGGMGSMSSILAGRSTTSIASTESNQTSRLSSNVASASVSGLNNDASGTASPAPTPAAPPARIQLSDLQNILSGLATHKPDNSAQADLSLSLTADAIIPLLTNEDFQKRLIEFLPEADIIPKNFNELKSTMHCPQFQQALQSFSAALASGQLGPLMAQFGLSEDAINAANKGDFIAFAKALEKSNDKEKN